MNRYSVYAPSAYVPQPVEYYQQALAIQENRIKEGIDNFNTTYSLYRNVTPYGADAEALYKQYMGEIDTELGDMKNAKLDSRRSLQRISKIINNNDRLKGFTNIHYLTSKAAELQKKADEHSTKYGVPVNLTPYYLALNRVRSQKGIASNFDHRLFDNVQLFDYINVNEKLLPYLKEMKPEERTRFLNMAGNWITKEHVKEITDESIRNRVLAAIESDPQLQAQLQRNADYLAYQHLQPVEYDLNTGYQRIGERYHSQALQKIAENRKKAIEAKVPKNVNPVEFEKARKEVLASLDEQERKFTLRSDTNPEGLLLDPTYGRSVAGHQFRANTADFFGKLLSYRQEDKDLILNKFNLAAYIENRKDQREEKKMQTFKDMFPMEVSSAPIETGVDAFKDPSVYDQIYPGLSKMITLSHNANGGTVKLDKDKVIQYSTFKGKTGGFFGRKDLYLPSDYILSNAPNIGEVYDRLRNKNPGLVKKYIKDSNNPTRDELMRFYGAVWAQQGSGRSGVDANGDIAVNPEYVYVANGSNGWFVPNSVFTKMGVGKDKLTEQNSATFQKITNRIKEIAISGGLGVKSADGVFRPFDRNSTNYDDMLQNWAMGVVQPVISGKSYRFPNMDNAAFGSFLADNVSTAIGTDGSTINMATYKVTNKTGNEVPLSGVLAQQKFTIGTLPGKNAGNQLFAMTSVNNGTRMEKIAIPLPEAYRQHAANYIAVSNKYANGDYGSHRLPDNTFAQVTAKSAYRYTTPIIGNQEIPLDNTSYQTQQVNYLKEFYNATVSNSERGRININNVPALQRYYNDYIRSRGQQVTDGGYAIMVQGKPKLMYEYDLLTFKTDKGGYTAYLAPAQLRENMTHLGEQAMGNISRSPEHLQFADQTPSKLFQQMFIANPGTDNSNIALD